MPVEITPEGRKWLERMGAPTARPEVPPPRPERRGPPQRWYDGWEIRRIDGGYEARLGRLVMTAPTAEEIERKIDEWRRRQPVQVVLPVPVEAPAPTLDEILERIRREAPARPPRITGPSRALISPSVQEIVRLIKVSPKRAREIVREVFESEGIGAALPHLLPYLERPAPPTPEYYMSFLKPRRAIKRSDPYSMSREILALRPRRMVLVSADFAEHEVAVPASAGELSRSLERLGPGERIVLHFDDDRAFVWRL
jgi:hypothetical protein